MLGMLGMLSSPRPGTFHCVCEIIKNPSNEQVNNNNNNSKICDSRPWVTLRIAERLRGMLIMLLLQLQLLLLLVGKRQACACILIVAIKIAMHC